MEKAKILVVEDEAIIADDVKLRLRQMGHDVLPPASNADQALRAASEEKPDLVLMDIMLQGALDGIDTAARIRSDLDIPVIYLTAYSEDTILERARHTEPFGYVLKPFSDDELSGTIQMALFRHRMETSLRRSEKRYRGLFNSVPVGICVAALDGSLIDINPALRTTLGIDPEEAVFGWNVSEFFDRPRDWALFIRELEENDQLWNYEFRARRADGLPCWLQVRAQVVSDEKNVKTHIEAIVEDVTERRRLDEEKEASRKFIQSVIDGVTDGIVVLDTNHRILLMNRTARFPRDEPLASYDEGLREDVLCYRYSHGLDRPCSGAEHPCPLQDVLKSGKAVTVVHRHLREDGETVPVEILASPMFDHEGRVTGIIEVSRDISERLRLEEERRQLLAVDYERKKAETTLTLAGGTAHEFNNILAVIMGSAELMRLRGTSPAEGNDHIENILSSCRKMSDLTGKLLAYAQGGKFQPRAVDLAAITGRALNRAVGGPVQGEIDLVFAAPEDLWKVLADPSQMEQLLSNVLLNAVESMEGRAGRLAVSLTNENRERDWLCVRHQKHQRGRFVRIRVSDGGPGIPVEYRERIFEPFFSTKFMGRGLGLPAALGIVQNHGGCISLEDGEENGTTVEILLPAAEPPHEDEETSLQETGTAFPQSVLIVDDDEAVLDVLSSTLDYFGYPCLKATGGTDALQALKWNRDEIGLVVLDIQMPGMSGRDVYRVIKNDYGSLPVLISSGYDNKEVLGLTLRPEDGFLQKPYRTRDFMDQVKRQLKTGPSG